MIEVASGNELLAELLFRLAGAFYVFAGYIATRAALTSRLLDVALAAISGKRPSAIETAQTCWHGAAAALVLAGGAMLALMRDGAQWAFLASLGGQAVYLFIVAPLVFDRDDPPDPKGRGQTTNAAMLYGLATAAVLWAAASGMLRPWEPISAAIFGLACATFLGWLAMSLFASSRGASPSAAPQAEPHANRVPTSIKVMASLQRHPLWSLDPLWEGTLPPWQVDISTDLSDALAEWGDNYDAAPRDGDADRPAWTIEQINLHDAEGRALAQRLAGERPGIEVHFEGMTGLPERIHPVIIK
jgi:hypothetical protein